MDNNSLAHTKWNCKYHIVLTLSTIINIYQKNNCHTMRDRRKFCVIDKV